MRREYFCDALILSVKATSEKAYGVRVFTRTGIENATLFGGPKSRLRSLVCPWNRGRIWLYKSDAKNICKITDFDVVEYHLSFRENLFKMYAANLAAEILINTRCAGSPKECWTLVNGFLDGMELSEEKGARIGLLRFLWRFIDLLGIKPQTAFCPQCSASYCDENAPQSAVYSENENGFVCCNCADCSQEATKGRFVLGNEAINYLQAVSSLSPRQSRAIVISARSFSQIRNLCFFMAESACGRRLNALKTGSEIL